ncbi:SDR family NAD(P)-dependent oxidoreductase [Novosphingobium taihuense]|uniref:NAD(P)-dependent dehydrogenase (Short-subunit alcohol dehydrogenase family) n=1 Tax=Novosphingobium taihuense TaxID=260085 RepID=A0A7W7EVG4_9SPHN|nr:SDR family oxidoreductase [Novosphingobium taihuense]MBB4615049.1 NAD(P)-dependent dehydrogenase (short-subunit alcohol dehydrogenase family) [Novosphingobium taihuense]TWH79282.1 NAD(P)-dependent dehydrogenase (short-subunit alcohol dehydrogenase family) [Novosphingobium taihuense]
MEDLASIFGLNGKVALVTGAADGIGREIAKLFHLAGATVIGADINAAKLASLPDELPGAHIVTYDQGDPDSIANLFEQVDLVGPIDVLINCAAVYPFRKFEDVDSGFLDKMLAINLRGPFQCVQHAVGRMKVGGRGGSIVNISSVNSMRACIFDNVHYGVGKAGVNNLTVSIALEYAEHNIRVNSVLPGGVATTHAAAESDGYPLRGPFTQAGRIPLTGAAGKPEDIARACLFLSSDASRYITGQIIAVDGGFLIS